MRAPDLVEGAKYILKNRHVSATFEGKHVGKLVLADGSTFYGGNGALKFRYTNPETGLETVALLESGAEVEEAEATKLERERITAEREAAEARTMQEARSLLESLGFTVVKQSYDVRRSEDPATTVALSLRYPDGRGAGAEIEIEEFTVGKLRLALTAIRPRSNRPEVAESAELA